MCLILVREPGVEIDPNKLENAVINNPDGWGYVIPDRGQLEVRRFYNGENTDPDDVLKFVEDNPDQKIYLHLRFATAGAKSKANVHPFPVLTQRKHGTQVMVMHNGTFTDYKKFGSEDNRASDTAIFTQKVLTPILARFAKNNSKKNLLSDPIVKTVLDKFNEGWSRLVLMDSFGNDIRLGDGSEDTEGLWLSNDYSFRKNYRSTNSQTAHTTGFVPQNNGNGTYSYTKRNPKTGTATVIQGTATSNESTKGGASNLVRSYAERAQEQLEEARAASPFRNKNETTQGAQSGTSNETTTKEVTSYAETSASQPTTRKPNSLLSSDLAIDFLDSFGLDDWSELFALDEDDIYSLVSEHPELMSNCIRDLLYVLYSAEEVN